MAYKYKGLVDPLMQIPEMEALLNCIIKGESTKVINMVDACKAHFAYAMSCLSHRKIVIITYDELSTKKIVEDMQALKGEDKVLVYPSRDILFYNADVHSMDITAARLKVINALINKEEDYVVIIPVEALLNPLSPKETWQGGVMHLKVGEILNVASMVRKLIEIGYERTSRVEAIGQFAVRGGIIDLYSPISDEAYRIELWDDEIDSIRTFNTQTQRSINKIEEIAIVPNQEIIFPLATIRKYIPQIKAEMEKTTQWLRQENQEKMAQRLREQVQEAIEQITQGISPRGLEQYIPFTDLKLVSILEYISKDTLMIIDEPTKTQDKCQRVLQEYHSSMEDRLNYGHILPTQLKLIFDYKEITDSVAPFTKVYFMNFEGHIEDTIHYTLPLEVHENTTFYKNLDLLQKDLMTWKEKKKKIVILSGVKAKALRLCSELEDRGIVVHYTEDMETMVEPGQVLIYKGYLAKGFSYEDINFYIIADKDLFGKEKVERKRKKKYQGAKIQSFLELSPGDYVVHEQYGIGVFQGIEQIKVEGISKDNLKIEYADKNILYVNINQMDLVQKYVGAEGKTPKLNKIGGSEWHKSKAKVRGAIKNIAKDLIKLYSQRQFERGFQYEPDTVWQREFEEMFPYQETGDQLDAIEDVKKDMESDKIMDRLICGDVGYGKTEVAIRAAFKAVQNSKQVAYLVPTTILAQQHYKRFAERMENYPINVQLLSRFRTPKQIKETLKGLEKGQVDIVIGTHRLLSSDVIFKDLGLVIIDEEQRFGVTHKEKLKQMRTQVDVMNLTATPIPRTLHMSLIGVRDMSVLEEAPVERKAVQTYVIEFSEDFIKDAISRELAREGQVYFLHNQVKNIEEMALKVQHLVPDARVSFAHGQMSERELEKIMLDFIQGEIDVLVCTTIIETGLDISNANTIIINGADRMGLSQLYQLRGRVGRSNRMGYAYLMYQKNKVLKEVAEKRLQAIKQFTELGAGFKIAMRDLEIRGAGNLLGAQQHGHMESVGYDLYCKMLSEVVREEKGEKEEQVFETAIEIKINAYIPSTFIKDEIQKLDIYKKIASISGEVDYLDVQEEIEDRYGNIPQTVYNLLDIALIKAMAHQLYITLVRENQKKVTFKFKEEAPLDATALPELVKIYGKKMKFIAGKEPSIIVNLEEDDPKQLLGNIKNILHSFNKLKSGQ